MIQDTDLKVSLIKLYINREKKARLEPPDSPSTLYPGKLSFASLDYST